MSNHTIRGPRRGPALSRRQALAAAAVGVGLTAGSAITIASAHERKSPAGNGGGAADKDADAIVVRVRDLAAGTMDVFTGTERIEVRDRDLAKRLAKAARKR